MDAYVTREPIDRELRRRQLAQRLVTHQARTQTIFNLTGLSRHQLATLRRRWRVTADMRHRGPPPASFGLFLSTQRVRDEAAALAVFWRILSHVRSVQGPVPPPSRIEAGECICEVFEAYVACFPMCAIELEHLTLLMRGIEEADAIALARCGSCDAVILVDLLGTRRRVCAACQGPEPSPAAPAQSLMETARHKPFEHGEAVQQELF